MKLEVQFPQLQALVTKMRANPIRWASNLERLETPEYFVELSTRGVEISLDEVEKLENGLLTYRGEQVLLYIKDTRQERETLLYDAEKARRFHVADCETLDRMRHEHRFERYVVTNRRDGLFLVDALASEDGTIEEMEAPLKVCRNCLKKLNYDDYEHKSYREKKKEWRSFDIGKFFEKYSSYFRSKPKYTDKTAPKSDYTDDWDVVSKKIREARGWKCGECKVSLKEHRRLLHVHHYNGVRADNSPTNLRVVCALCHKAQPAHGRMYVAPEHEALIMRLRSEQGLKA